MSKMEGDCCVKSFGPKTSGGESCVVGEVGPKTCVVGGSRVVGRSKGLGVAGDCTRAGESAERFLLRISVVACGGKGEGVLGSFENSFW